MKDFISSSLDVRNDEPGVCDILVPFPLGVSEDVVRLGHSTLAFYMQSCLGCVCVVRTGDSKFVHVERIYTYIYILCIYILQLALYI